MVIEFVNDRGVFPSVLPTGIGTPFVTLVILWFSIQASR